MKHTVQLNKTDWLIFLLLKSAYLISRLANLKSLPIFTDEAIYLRWSQIGSYDAVWRFIPLTDGKPPLFHWFVMATIRLFSDPLVAGRIVSVTAGGLSLLGIWLLAYSLFQSKHIAHVSSFFYLISPFTLVYDRLAIVDSLLTTTSIWSLLFAAILIKTIRLDAAIILGGTIGLGLLTKTSGLFFLLLSPATLILNNWTPKLRKTKLFQWTGLLILSAFLSQLVYGVLRLSQFFYRIDQKNSEFIISISDFIKDPFALTWGNAKSLFAWQLGYTTLPIALLIILSFSTTKYWRQKLLLLVYYTAPFLLIASFNKIIFPRFLLFSTPFLLILAATGFHQLASKTKAPLIKLTLLFVLSLSALLPSVTWILNPAKAAIPQADKDQYIQGTPSGHGVTQIVEFLKTAALNGPIFLGTDGTFGLTPDAFDVYLRNHHNIQIKGYYPVSTIPQEVIDLANDKQTYFVYFNVQDIPPQQNIDLIAEFEKTSPSNTTHLRLYRVNPL